MKYSVSIKRINLYQLSFFIILSVFNMNRSVWFELLAGQWPFSKHPNQSVVWQIGKGVKQGLGGLGVTRETKVCQSTLKSFILFFVAINKQRCYADHTIQICFKSYAFALKEAFEIYICHVEYSKPAFQLTSKLSRRILFR